MNGLMYISQKVGKKLITEITSHFLFFFYKEITGQKYLIFTKKFQVRFTKKLHVRFSY